VSKPGIVLIKSFSYRGHAEEWSNVYHFSESPPTTPAAWKTLVDLVIAQEKTCYGTGCKVVRAYCYADSDNDATTSIDYTLLGAEVPGTLPQLDQIPQAGDAAVWIRWVTAKHNTKGKIVYLRKYFHNAMVNSTGGADVIYTAQKNAMQAFGDKLTNGTITGFTLCGKDGTDALTASVSPFVTTRTLKRRGKRPPS